MFSHIVLGANNIEAAKKFYDAALGALGQAAGIATPDGVRVVYQSEAGILMVTQPLNGEPASFANGGTVGFVAQSKESVDLFHSDGIAAGGYDAGLPGARDAIPGSYAAYLRDPTGNKLVAWCVDAG